MNKVIRIQGSQGYGTIAILDTPCFPARYYAGFVIRGADGDYTPENNSTELFHRTLEEAEEGFKQWTDWVAARIKEEQEKRYQAVNPPKNKADPVIPCGKSDGFCENCPYIPAPSQDR